MRRAVLHLLIFVLILAAQASCEIGTPSGDCGPVLSSAECVIVRAQLGTLDEQPPPDPSSRVGQWDGSDPVKKEIEDRAAALGQRLFFDRCLSGDRQTGCVTCHDPQNAFIDARERELLVPVAVMKDGKPATELLPPIEAPTPERVLIPPPEVRPQLDPTGMPLAVWNPEERRWRGVVRRSQASRSSGGSAYTGRNSPTLYNVAYGAAHLPPDGARVAGATWVPWDGRYDSNWALIADVFEFGATHRTNRAHLALRVYQKHKAPYEAAFGPMPNFNQTDGGAPPLLRYPRNASPATPFSPAWVECWNNVKCPLDEKTGFGIVLPIPDTIKAEINQIHVNAAKALAAYMRRLTSRDAPYDRWLRGDKEAMSPAAQRGLRLFIGKAECIMCHGGPNFTDWRFHNLGVPSFDPERRVAGSDVAPVSVVAPQPDLDCFFPGAPPGTRCPDPGRWAWRNRLSGRCELDVDAEGRLRRDAQGKARVRPCQRSSWLACTTSYSDDTSRCLPYASCLHTEAARCKEDPACAWFEDHTLEPKVALCAPRADESEKGQFKTPSLRNVAMTWPYMHNGAIYDYGPAERGETSKDDPAPHLRRVIEFYNQGGTLPQTGGMDPLIRPLHLSGTEIADLVEFLKALTDERAGRSELGQPPADLADLSDCPP